MITITSNKHPLEYGLAPAWASAWGEDDRFGPWVEIEFKEVCQRLRWIPPGSFLMGSPDTEVGRIEREGPRHEVTLTSGYWLFDTPCTQAFWQAVMGDNPSHFVSPDRPVDSVSWNDVSKFLAAVNQAIPDLNLGLPTEAQWEYACRSGTDGATWLGDLEILGQRNAPLLDSIAWYGGNSGVDFDLDNGFDSSGWTEKQYAHQRAGSRIVKQKAANPWGLFDMLGNVWEWCEDGRRDYSEPAVVDPVGLTDSGSNRVLRGGSWFDYARDVRAAYRLWVAPDYRVDDTGFRCARVHDRPAEV